MANKPGEANFFPDVPAYPEIGTFQPIYGKFDLTTYIQGASDYEIMAFLVGKYNATLEAYGTVTKLSTETIKAAHQLQDWINNWFDNLDVQQELNNKIDQMVADGSFGTLLHQTFDAQINQQTTNAVTAWLVANVTPTGSAVVVDKSLSIQGAAADAKATGEIRTKLIDEKNKFIKTNVLYSAETIEITGHGEWESKSITIDAKPNVDYFINIGSVVNNTTDTVVAVLFYDGVNTYEETNYTAEYINGNNIIHRVTKIASTTNLIIRLYRNYSPNTGTSGTTTFNDVLITKWSSNLIEIPRDSISIKTSDFNRLTDETDDSGKLNRCILAGIEAENAIVVIDELLTLEKGVSIVPKTGKENLVITSNFSKTAINASFYQGSWHAITTGIKVTNSCTVFTINNVDKTTEWSGIKFSKLAIVNDGYTWINGTGDSLTYDIIGIQFERATAEIKDCYFYGMKIAINNPYTSLAYSDMLTISNCDFHYFTTAAIIASRCDSAMINNNAFVPFDGYSNAVYIRGGAGCTLIDNTFANWGHKNESGEWVKCKAASTTDDDDGSFVIYGYDSNISVIGLHSEWHTGSAVIYAKGGNITVQSAKVPFCVSKTVLCRFAGLVNINGCEIEYEPSNIPFTDIYIVGSCGVNISSSVRRGGVNIIRPLKVATVNSSVGLSNTGVIVIEKTGNTAKFFNPYTSGDKADAIVDANKITAKISNYTGMAKTAIAAINSGDVSKCTSKIISDDNGINVEVELFGNNGEAYTGDTTITVVTY